jgi:glycosyltransferase involved in cell wall biosynthesis
MPDVRWFARNEYERLILPDLRCFGLDVATEGDASARLAVAMNHDLAPDLWRYSQRSRTPFVCYIWDLPSSRIGRGRYDPVVAVGGRLLALPRIGARYVTRRGYYSRLRYVAARALAVWTPSRSSADDVGRHFGLGASSVPYCYNSDVFTGVGTSGQEATARGNDPEAFSLLSISRLVPPKNHEAVIRAAARLGARVEIIGRGPSQASLEVLAHRLGVRCRIRSGLSVDDVVTAYRVASVVVCPSRFEGLGLTGIEGAICGTPVVASDIPPHREFLDTAAQFFTLDDDDSLVAAIERARTTGRPPTAQFAQLTIGATAQRFVDHLRPLL